MSFPPIPSCSPSLSVCNDCGSDDIWEDQKNGCVVCQQCGVVLSSQLISEEPEWRDFTDDDENGRSLNQTIVSRVNTNEDEDDPDFQGLSTIMIRKRKHPSTSYSITGEQDQDQEEQPALSSYAIHIQRNINNTEEVTEEQEIKRQSPSQRIIDKNTEVIQQAGGVLGLPPSEVKDAIYIMTNYVLDQVDYTKIRLKYRELSISCLWSVSRIHKKVSKETFVRYLDGDVEKKKKNINPRTLDHLDTWTRIITEWIRLKNQNKKT